MGLRFNDIAINDYFIDFNGITYQKIAESGGSCCDRGVNCLAINTGVGATNQFFPEGLIIAHAGFSGNYDDSDTGVQFWGEKFNNEHNLENVSGFLYLGQKDGSTDPNDFAHLRIGGEFDSFSIRGAIVRSIPTDGSIGLDIENGADRTGDYICTALFEFPALDLVSGDIHEIRFGSTSNLQDDYSYFGCRINGSGGLGIEYGHKTGIIELSENYLTNYTGQPLYLSCNYNYSTQVATITTKSSESSLATLMTINDTGVSSDSFGVMGFATADDKVGLRYWQTMITLQ